MTWPVLLFLLLLLPLSFILSAHFYSPSASLASVSFSQLIMEDETRGKRWEAPHVIRSRQSSCPRPPPPFRCRTVPKLAHRCATVSRVELCQQAPGGRLCEMGQVWMTVRQTSTRALVRQQCVWQLWLNPSTQPALCQTNLPDVEFRPLPTAGQGHGATAAEQNQITT